MVREIHLLFIFVVVVVVVIVSNPYYNCCYQYPLSCIDFIHGISLFHCIDLG